MRKRKVKELQYVILPNYVSVLLASGKTFQLHKSHPTFNKMVQALKRKQWRRVPELVNLAAEVRNVSHGNVKVTPQGVFYKGEKVNDAISRKILQLMDAREPIDPLMYFLNNVRENPYPQVANELYAWLLQGHFTLTQDGCFLAYKSVRLNYMDVHTGTIDNHVGQIVQMPSTAVDPDRRMLCSYGLHFCSKSYLYHFNGNRVMAVKIHPRDVIAIPTIEVSKGRCSRYEVVMELADQLDLLQMKGDAPIMQQPLVNLDADRQRLLKKFFNLAIVKRLIKRGKLQRNNIRKMPYARLAETYRKFAMLSLTPDASRLFENPMKFARKAAGLSIGQIANELGGADLGYSYDVLYHAEQSLRPDQKLVDAYLGAIMRLRTATAHLPTSAVSYPNPSTPATFPAATNKVPASSYSYGGYGYDDVSY